VVVGHLEVGADLHIHLEGHGPLVREDDGLDVELRLGDRVEVKVLVDLLERGHEQRRLDLFGDLLAEPLLDQLAGSPAGPEARDLGVSLEGAQRVLELMLDLGPRDGHLEMLLARPDILDLDIDIELAFAFQFVLGMLVRYRNRSVNCIFTSAHRGLSLG